MSERITPGIYRIITEQGPVTLEIKQGFVLTGREQLENSRLSENPVERMQIAQENIKKYLSHLRPSAGDTKDAFIRKWDSHHKRYGDDAIICLLPKDLDNGIKMVTQITNILLRSGVTNIDKLIAMTQEDMLNLPGLGEKSLGLFTRMQDIARAKKEIFDESE